MSLSMAGHIDSVFQSVPAILNARAGGTYVDGIWVGSPWEYIPYIVNLQPLNEREIDNLFRGGERIVDGRKVYINNGDLSKLKLGNNFTILNSQWKVVKSDVREWRNYAKIIIDRSSEEVPGDLDTDEKVMKIVVDQLYNLVNIKFPARL